jgi:phage baseplate assembly protein W
MSTYLGMSSETGRRLSDLDHLKQSVQKILGTSISTRLRRRPFGSLNSDLIDAPGNQATLVQLYAATATALMTWEPRLSLQSIKATVDTDNPGRYVFDINGDTVSASGAALPVSISTTVGA